MSKETVAAHLRCALAQIEGALKVTEDDMQRRLQCIRGEVTAAQKSLQGAKALCGPHTSGRGRAQANTTPKHREAAAAKGGSARAPAAGEPTAPQSIARFVFGDGPSHHTSVLRSRPAL
jgi:hypothetical protein